MYSHAHEHSSSSMATSSMGLALIYQNATTQNFRVRLPKRFICKSVTKTTPDYSSVDLRRRSGNYQPSPWDHRYLLSIGSKCTVKNNLR